MAAPDMDPDSPLQQRHCDCLDDCLRKNAECKRLIDRMQRAGIDMSVMESENDKRGTLARSLKAEFFPFRV